MFKPSRKTSWVRCNVLPAPFSHCGSSRCSPNLNRPNRNVHCNQISSWGIQVCTYIYTYMYIYICIYGYIIFIYTCILVYYYQFLCIEKNYMVNIWSYIGIVDSSPSRISRRWRHTFFAGETMTASVISENLKGSRNASLKDCKGDLTKLYPYIYRYIHYILIYILYNVYVYSIHIYAVFKEFPTSASL